MRSVCIPRNWGLRKIVALAVCRRRQTEIVPTPHHAPAIDPTYQRQCGIPLSPKTFSENLMVMGVWQRVARARLRIIRYILAYIYILCCICLLYIHYTCNTIVWCSILVPYRQRVPVQICICSMKLYVGVGYSNALCTSYTYCATRLWRIVVAVGREVYELYG